MSNASSIIMKFLQTINMGQWRYSGIGHQVLIGTHVLRNANKNPDVMLGRYNASTLRKYVDVINKQPVRPLKKRDRACK